MMRIFAIGRGSQFLQSPGRATRSPGVELEAPIAAVVWSDVRWKWVYRQERSLRVSPVTPLYRWRLRRPRAV
jgi:hypothetical protein